MSEIPIVENQRHPDLYEFPDPIFFVERAISQSIAEQITIKSEVINDLLNKFDSSEVDQRYMFFDRLSRIFEYGLMTNHQIQAFSNSLWKVVDASGFPKGLNRFYKSYFLTIPRPPGIAIEKMYHEFLLKLEFPVVGNSNTYPISGGVCRPCSEILGGVKFLKSAEWNSNDAVELFNKIIFWWNQDKQHFRIKEVSSAFVSRNKDLRDKFFLGGRVIADAIIPFLSGEHILQVDHQLKQLIEEMSDFNIPVSEIRASYLESGALEASTYIDKITADVFSEDDIVAARAIIALARLLNSDNAEAIDHLKRMTLLSPIVEAIKWRRSSVLPAALYQLKKVIEMKKTQWEETTGSILIGLEHIANESNLVNSESQIPAEERLIIREHAAALAYFLFVIHKSEGKPIPRAIKLWMQICKSDDEFAEIKNQWL